MRTIAYSITDGTTTLSSGGSNWVNGSGAWGFSPDVSTLKDGNLTLTVTEGDAYGNLTVYTAVIPKGTVAPKAPTVALNASSDSGVSNIDYITNVVNPSFVTTSAAGTSVTVYVNGAVYTGQTLASGTYTVTATATDAFGNVSSVATAPRQLVVDTTPPTGTFTFNGAVSSNGQLAVKSQALTLALSFTDAHGPATMAFSTDGVNYSTAVPYASSGPVTLPSATNGLYTVYVRVTDLAGNSAVFSRTVRLDTTGPTITDAISAPTNNGSYDLGTNPTLTYSATDIDGVSSITASLDGATSVSSGSTINLYTLLAGTHTITFTGTDTLGNVSSATITIQVHATLTGLVNAVNYGAMQAYIPSTTKTTLLATLTSASNALKAGNATSEKSYLATFVTQVKTASLKVVASYQTLLVNWTQDLIARS
jgi:hypothetical protein